MTYPWTLIKLFHLPLPLYHYQSQLLKESWDSQGQKKHLFEIISLQNQKHYTQFHRNMTLIIPLKPKSLWSSAFIRFIFPDISITIKLFGFINDAYKVDSIKNMARHKRGTCSTKFNITGFEQNMPQGNNWRDFLNDNE